MKNVKKFISIVVPVYNEEWCIHPLYGKLSRVFSGYHSREIIFVDDGSTDGTKTKIAELVGRDKSVKAIHLRRNFGLTQALQAGFDHAKGEYIVTISGNLQNEPEDIPRLIHELEEGYDVCVGWPAVSGNGELSRARPRMIFNWVISKISGVKLHDYECMLRAYRRELLDGMQLYGNLEQYIPIYVHWRGGRIAELEVTQHPRSHGKGKRKNTTRQALKMTLDLLMLKFVERYSDRPLHMFGALGVGAWFVGLLTFIWMVLIKLFFNRSFIETPLPLVTTLFLLTGVLLIVLGIISEFVAKVYHSGSGRPLYDIKQVNGFSEHSEK